MIPHNICGYVLSNDFRLLNRWLNPIGAVIVILFSMKFLKRAVVEQNNILPHLVAAAIFMSVGVLLLVARHRNSKILGLSYSCEKNLITNQCCLGKHCLDINHSFFITEISIAFTMKGTWFEHFFILSSDPFSRIPSIGNSGLHVIKNLWKEGVIILPASEEIRIWIAQIIGICQIPQHPKVAYLQKNNT